MFLLLSSLQISELREHLDQIPSSADAEHEGSEGISGPEILFGRQRIATKEDILAALPPRREADLLIDTFFAMMDTHASTSPSTAWLWIH